MMKKRAGVKQFEEVGPRGHCTVMLLKRQVTTNNFFDGFVVFSSNLTFLLASIYAKPSTPSVLQLQAEGCYRLTEVGPAR